MLAGERDSADAVSKSRKIGSVYTRAITRSCGPDHRRTPWLKYLPGETVFGKMKAVDERARSRVRRKRRSQI